MKLLIVRHGDPNYAIDSLTEKGWREAGYLTERMLKLDIKKIYCSPLGRAKDTAAETIKRSGVETETCDWLREFTGYIINPHTGEKDICWDLYPEDWVGVPEMYDKDRWFKTDLMQTGNVEEKYKEVCRGIDKLLADHGYIHENGLFRVERANNDTIVLFCHFGVEAAILSHLLHVSPVILWQGFVALPTSVTTLATEERREGVAYFRLNGFGDLSHLYAAGEPPAFAARFCECFTNEDEVH